VTLKFWRVKESHK